MSIIDDVKIKQNFGEKYVFEKEEPQSELYKISGFKQIAKLPEEYKDFTVEKMWEKNGHLCVSLIKEDETVCFTYDEEIKEFTIGIEWSNFPEEDVKEPQISAEPEKQKCMEAIKTIDCFLDDWRCLEISLMLSSLITKHKYKIEIEPQIEANGGEKDGELIRLIKERMEAEANAVWLKDLCAVLTNKDDPRYKALLESERDAARKREKTNPGAKEKG